MKYIFIGTVIILAACSSSEKITQNTSDLTTYFRGEIPSAEPGGAILIMKGDSIIFSEGYGIADINTKEPITPKTLFNLGSISKTFVANAILMLQEQGKLSVEDSLTQYFPDFKNKSIASKVRIKHLLTHTSGLPDNRPVEKNMIFYLTAKDAENWKPITQTDTLVFESGSQFQYSNPAFNALALIVEQVSGIKWQTFVQQNIMRPSGMATSTITDGPHPEAGVSHSYNLDQNTWTEADYGEVPTFAAAGNGGVWSSVEELANYERALQKSVFLKPETIADSRTVKHFPEWSSTAQPRIGWSWFIGQTSDSLKTVGHTGSQGGFLCNYVTIPDKKILIVILCNTPRDVRGFTTKIMGWLKETNYLEE
jgi:CubicO group peptidase (beta-lactamase class C family)